MFLPSSAPKSINTVQCDFYLFAEPFHVHSWKYIIYKWQQCHNIHFVIIWIIYISGHRYLYEMQKSKCFVKKWMMMVKLFCFDPFSDKKCFYFPLGKIFSKASLEQNPTCIQFANSPCTDQQCITLYHIPGAIHNFVTMDVWTIKCFVSVQCRGICGGSSNGEPSFSVENLLKMLQFTLEPLL